MFLACGLWQMSLFRPERRAEERSPPPFALRIRFLGGSNVQIWQRLMHATCRASSRQDSRESAFLRHVFVLSRHTPTFAHHFVSQVRLFPGHPRADPRTGRATFLRLFREKRLAELITVKRAVCATRHRCLKQKTKFVRFCFSLFSAADPRMELQRGAAISEWGWI